MSDGPNAPSPPAWAASDGVEQTRPGWHPALGAGLDPRVDAVSVPLVPGFPATGSPGGGHRVPWVEGAEAEAWGPGSRAGEAILGCYLVPGRTLAST